MQSIVTAAIGAPEFWSGDGGTLEEEFETDRTVLGGHRRPGLSNMGVAYLMGLMLYHAAQRHLALSADTRGGPTPSAPRDELDSFTVIARCSVRSTPCTITERRGERASHRLHRPEASEQIGLQWSDVDWSRKLICVRRGTSRFGEGETKTEGSVREVHMLPRVRRALKAQRASTDEGSIWVFPNERVAR